jgi:hypothetical protein
MFGFSPGECRWVDRYHYLSRRRPNLFDASLFVVPPAWRKQRENE